MTDEPAQIVGTQRGGCRSILAAWKDNMASLSRTAQRLEALQGLGMEHTVGAASSSTPNWAVLFAIKWWRRSIVSDRKSGLACGTVPVMKDGQSEQPSCRCFVLPSNQGHVIVCAKSVPAATRAVPMCSGCRQVLSKLQWRTSSLSTECSYKFSADRLSSFNSIPPGLSTRCLLDHE